MFTFIKTIIISGLIIFLVQQIYSFIKSNVTPPKIKLPRVEKYKSMFDDIATASKPLKINKNSKVILEAAAAAKVTPEEAAAILNLESFDLEEIKDLKINDNDDVGNSDDDFDFDDNGSVYSDGFTALKDDMEQDLINLITGGGTESTIYNSTAPFSYF